MIIVSWNYVFYQEIKLVGIINSLSHIQKNSHKVNKNNIIDRLFFV